MRVTEDRLISCVCTSICWHQCSRRTHQKGGRGPFTLSSPATRRGAAAVIIESDEQQQEQQGKKKKEKAKKQESQKKEDGQKKEDVIRIQTFDYTTLVRVAAELRGKLLPGM